MQKYAEKLLRHSGTDCAEMAAQWNSRNMMEAFGDVPQAELTQHMQISFILELSLTNAKSLAY